MEKITIKIRHLGRVRDSEITLSPLMVISGESGLGKSYVSILCHYFFDILLDKQRINYFISENGWSFMNELPRLKGEGEVFHFSRQALEVWMAKDVVNYLKYMLNNPSLEADLSITLPDTIDQNISFVYTEEINAIEDNTEVYIKLTALGLNYKVKEEEMGEESPFAFLLRFGLIKGLFGDFKSLSDTYVYPPSRGPVLTEEVTPRTGLYEKFKNGLLKLDRIPALPESVDTELIDLFQEIMGGRVSRDHGNYVYSIKDGVLPISAAAASVRELAPLSMLVERTDLTKVALLIEEPEAHLHPLKQRQMADIIALISNTGAFMQITTHSDYFLRRLNELIDLQRIYETKGEDEFENLCKEMGEHHVRLDYSRLSAYLLVENPDGTSHIVSQDIRDGIPFASFSEAIDQSLTNRFRINEYLNEDECN